MGSEGISKHAYAIFFLQTVFLILFGIFASYSPEADAKFHPISNNETQNEVTKDHLGQPDPNAHIVTYPYFQDVHVMIFVGFGFLMTFLKKYGFGAVGLNFLIAAMSIEWGLLVNGFFHLHNGYILVNLNNLLSADFTAAAVLISYGAVIGKATPLQLVLMVIFEIPIFAANEVLGRKLFTAIDMGDSMFVHAFGAYFGLSVSLMLHRRDASTPKEGSSYRSDLFAMIGTVFLWMYWPSFNAGAATGDSQHRAIINTYIALCSCCLTAFAVSSMVHPEKKFDMVHIQNSTLAGGVAIGTSADLMIHPWGAVLVGMVAGTVSVLGYAFLTPILSKKLKIHDTCGVHNLHGMPGVMAGIIGCIMAAVATEADYGVSLYKIFPSRAPIAGSPELAQIRHYIPDLEPGFGWSAGTQASYQIFALLVTLGIAIAGGLVTGMILRMKLLQELDTDDLYEDSKYWLVEEGGEDSDSAVGIAMTQKNPSITRMVAAS